SVIACRNRRRPFSVNVARHGSLPSPAGIPKSRTPPPPPHERSRGRTHGCPAHAGQAASTADRLGLAWGTPGRVVTPQLCWICVYFGVRGRCQRHGNPCLPAVSAGKRAAQAASELVVRDRIE